MSTKNDASQTLFRMVSLRNPQLTEIKSRNLGFIQRPKGATGVFDIIIKNRAADNGKISAMEAFIKTSEFQKTAFQTEKELEEGPFGQLLIIGRKVSRKEKLTDGDWQFVKEFYANLIDTNKELTIEGIKVFEKLWSNLIYQTISQKDFYIKEAISDILKAIHLGFAQSMTIDEDFKRVNGEKTFENGLNGKIVLPQELFVEDEISNNQIATKGSTATTLSKTTELRLINEAQANAQVQSAILKKESLKKLENELKAFQKSYYKQKEAAYKVSFDKYLEENKSALNEYETVSEEIEHLVEQKTPEEELQPLYEKINNLAVAPHEFTYKNEIDVAEFNTKLSSKSFDAMVETVSNTGIQNISEQKTVENLEILSSREMRVGESLIQINDDYETIDDVITKIQEEISSLTQVTLDNTPLTQEHYINLGGATIPVNQNIERTPLAYAVIIGLDRSGAFISFSFEVEDATWNVATAKIIADTDYGHYEETYSNLLVRNNKIVFPPILVKKFKAPPSFKIEIVFTNEREASAQIDTIAYNTVKTGMLLLKAIDENTSQTADSKRKNFGIKRLGIADYLKVVQSVHAYVPGLVSNIENVMASELRHKSSVSRDYSEVTDTTSKSQENEKLSDTSKTSRTDMQTEIAKEIDKQKSITANTRFSYNTGVYNFEISGGFANNTAQHDSTRQAVMKSQEVTEKAMEKVLTKISEERIQKIIKEYTETNVHEFDNRGKVTETDNAEAAQPKHISGVYRWIDIKYKNQIYNYGKRTMFEFMIPEPAKLHRLALATSKAQILTAPIDPRKAEDSLKMTDAKTATKELLEYWAQIYKVEITSILPNTKQVQHQAISRPDTDNNFGIDHTRFDIPENYIGKNAKFICRSSRNRGGGWSGSRYSLMEYSNLKGGFISKLKYGSVNFEQDEFGLNVSGNVDFGVKGHNVDNYNITVTVNCELSSQYVEQWKKENFNAIINAYEEAYTNFKEEQAKLDEEQKKKEQEAKDKMGQFYRYMEHDVLKHNCIAYLLQDYANILGTSFTQGDKMEDFQVHLGEDLDKYTALAKFMEQAFEWEVMDYTFYSYYWAKRAMWKEMYISDSVDPLFRSFLQAGLARVIVTVKPGFEDAVQFFMTTGKIWNGGEVPVIGDPLYMSIVDEMRAPVGKPQGKYWITKLPSTLTILQDNSTGLKVEEDQALPIFPVNDPEQCENPNELENNSSFRLDEANLLRSDKTESTLPKN
ncbi:hypothetical protein [Flavobacterium sp.]|uniref:hypothetical protein n=1 Tax=Flavobacterium sp. TaxID=239 RepID=UPI004047FFC3